MTPQSEKRKFYVYGIWIDNRQIICNNGEPEISEFDDIDNALVFMKSKILSNINISWTIVSNIEYLENIKK